MVLRLVFRDSACGRACSDCGAIARLWSPLPWRRLLCIRVSPQRFQLCSVHQRWSLHPLTVSPAREDCVSNEPVRSAPLTEPHRSSTSKPNQERFSVPSPLAQQDVHTQATIRPRPHEAKMTGYGQALPASPNYRTSRRTAVSERVREMRPVTRRHRMSIIAGWL